MNDTAAMLILCAVLCLISGFMIGVTLQSIQTTGSRDACRAANPGYECVVGWVRGEAFE